MGRTSPRLAAVLTSVLGLLLLSVGVSGTSLAAPLRASDLPDGIVGVTWQLQSMQNKPPAVTRPMEQGITITLVFDGKGGLTGQGACNSYFASYSVGTNSAITIGPIGSTQKACAENLMNLDQEYFGALQTASKYTYYQATMGLSTNNGSGTLNYISATAPSPGMPTTGSSTQPLFALIALALGICLVAAGVVVNRRRSESH